MTFPSEVKWLKHGFVVSGIGFSALIDFSEAKTRGLKTKLPGASEVSVLLSSK
jgi:hypothetical protein